MAQHEPAGKVTLLKSTAFVGSVYLRSSAVSRMETCSNISSFSTSSYKHLIEHTAHSDTGPHCLPACPSLVSYKNTTDCWMAQSDQSAPFCSTCSSSKFMGPHACEACETAKKRESESKTARLLPSSICYLKLRRLTVTLCPVIEQPAFCVSLL